ncbi:unnamed protein product, partial [Prorocentrum cordatum]
VPAAAPVGLQLAASGWTGGAQQQGALEYGASDLPKLRELVRTFASLGDKRQEQHYRRLVEQLEAAARPPAPPTVGAAKHALGQARVQLDRAVAAAELEQQLDAAKHDAIEAHANFTECERKYQEAVKALQAEGEKQELEARKAQVLQIFREAAKTAFGSAKEKAATLVDEQKAFTKRME